MPDLTADQVEALRRQLRRLTGRLGKHQRRGRDMLGQRAALLVQLLDAGVPQAELARDCGVSPNAIADTVARVRANR